MSSLVAGLLVLMTAVIADRLIQGPSRRRLAAREQRFRILAIRDELQMLVVKGVLTSESRAYGSLIRFCESAIEYARPDRHHRPGALPGELPGMEAGDLLRETEAELRIMPPEVQALAADLFTELARMLIASDWMVRAGVAAAQHLATGWSRFAPVFELFRGVMDRVVPDRSRAVSWFMEYRQAARRLVVC